MRSYLTMLGSSSIVLALLTGACAGDPDPVPAGDSSDVTSDWWTGERAKRQAALDDYLNEHRAELESFVNVPLGHSGFPVMMMRVFGELMPDLWAPDGDPTLAALGLGTNPWKKETRLPFGFGYSYNDPPLVPFAPIGIQVANFTCGACHVGRVQLENGKVQNLLGAPNTRFDASAFFKALTATPTHPGLTEERLKAAIASKPNGYFYGDELNVAQEKLERAVFSAAAGLILQKTAEGIGGNAKQRDLIAQKGYDKPGSPDFYASTPGRADAFGLTVVQFVNQSTLDELPTEPAITDIMSVWNQKDRAVSHWGGEMRSGVWPVVAAEFAVAGASKIVNVDNLEKSTSFLHGLPSPPYPFAVNKDRAMRGAKLFADNCASCHKAGDAQIYPLAELGTDVSRSKAFTPYTLEKFNAALKDSCRNGSVCQDIPENIIQKTAGYVATPLDGIWARAPYLHNGSVPTLRQLLVPSSRPANFERGSIAYDQKNVGFVWDKKEKGTVTYDTSKLGQRNAGHDSPKYLGSVNWAQETEKLEDLLEYMKTL